MRYPLTLIFSLLGLFVFAQQRKSQLVQIVPEKTITLNSRSNGKFGGKHRVAVPFAFPKNTVRWYYAFAATDDSTKHINLLAQLQRIADSTNNYEFTASSLTLPEGVHIMPSYLLNYKNMDIFLYSKKTSSFDFITSGSRENNKNAFIEIKDVTAGGWFLGFENQLAAEDLTFQVEAVAVIKDESEWNETASKRLFEGFFNALKNNMEQGAADELSKCMVSKIVAEHTPNSYDEMTQAEKGAYLKTLISSCAEKK